jgi:glycosyltransferase involved in cell wall biosynthesis
VIVPKLSRLHIGLNAHLLSLSQTYRGAGISWYIYNLLCHLDQMEPSCRYTVFLHDRRFQQVRNLALRYSAFPTEKPVARILWEQFLQPIALKQAGIDLHHGLAFVAPVATPCPFIITVYDLSFKRYPEAFKPLNRLYLSTFTEQSVRRAEVVITISESTRQDVIQFFNLPPHKVHTVYCGVDDSFQILPRTQVETFKARHGLPEAFVLFVGTLEPRKNVAGLIEAYAIWRKQDKGAPKLFIGGGKGWHYQEVFKLVEKFNLTSEVVFPGYLPQGDLRLWYNAATMFVYPSRFEGFGLPVLEAMACGTPVVTSNVSSLPEVAGDAAWLVDPTDIDDLSEAMYRVFNNPDLRQTMRQKGLIQKARFSWRKTATETTQVYRQVLGG